MELRQKEHTAEYFKGLKRLHILNINQEECIGLQLEGRVLVKVSAIDLKSSGRTYRQMDKARIFSTFLRS
jgi:hypothetical protein